MTLGEQIRARRKAMGLTLEAFGQRVHLTKSFLCDVERGKRRIGADNLLVISQVTGIPMDHLMGQNGHTAPVSVPIQLPSSLIQFATNADIRFRDAVCLYGLMRVIMDHRLPPRRTDLEKVDWTRFWDAVKEWVET